MPQAYRVRTYEGSLFLVRFDPSTACPDYGHVKVAGFSQLMQKRLIIKGIAYPPEVGGRLTVSDEMQKIDYAGAVIETLPYETISSVEEIPLDDIR